MPADTLRHLQLEYVQRGTQTDSPPLPVLGIRPASCTCSCSCAPTFDNKELGNRSVLGNHPPRLSRLTNRVVSLPEAEAISAVSVFQPRVASMPGYFPPLFSEDEYLEDDFDFDLISPQVRYCAHLSPRTPSPPPILRRDLGDNEFAANGRSFYGEGDPQEWITWASSPPKPIPALHGPLSLPYARCPSGAEGTVIESDDRVSNMIWGLDNTQPLIRTPCEGTLTTGNGVQSVSGIVGSANDSLMLATARITKQLKGLAISGDTREALSQHHYASQLSGLGLHIHLTPPRRLDARSATFNTQLDRSYRPETRVGQTEAFIEKTSVRVASRGVSNSVDRLKPGASQLPTPPLSTSTHWTPRLSGELVGPSFSPLNSTREVSPALGYPEHRHSFSGAPVVATTPALDCLVDVHEWQNHPDGNAPTAQYQQDYSLDSESRIPGSGFDLYERSARRSSHKPNSSLVVSSRTESTGYKEKRHEQRGAGQDGHYIQSARNMIHRRLPVLEEDVSFGGSSPGRPSRGYQGPPSYKGTMKSRTSSGVHRETTVQHDEVGTGPTKHHSSSHRRWKQKREV